MTCYAFGDFSVDEARRALSRRGVEINVTPRAFDTLLHLLQRSGELVGKNELMQAVWPSRVIEENNLNQAISTLRRALGEQRGEHRYILTVPGWGYRFVAQVRTTSAFSARPLRSLAVLPFKLLPSSPDEALQTGLTDTLITRLSGLGGLIVRPLSAVHRFGAGAHDPVEVGRRLGVDAVLDGTIQQVVPRTRVSLRLIDIAGGQPQWSEIVDADAADLFALQDAVAEKAVAALALHLTGDQRVQLTRRYTDYPQAWRCHALGRFFVAQRSPAALQEAAVHFRQALAIDPAYALAHAALADLYTIQGVMGARAPLETGPQAREAALRALAIDERLSVAHYALGHALVQYDRDWAGAEAAYRRALALDPTSADAHHRYAILLMTCGRSAEAFAQIRRARELDPTSLPIDVTEGFLYYWDRQYARAAAHLRDMLEREPHFWMAHYWLAQVAGVTGDYDAASSSAQRAHELVGNGAAWLPAWVEAVAGNRVAAQAALEALLERSREHYIPSHDIAQVHAGLGDAEQLFAWLQRAEQDHSRHLDTLGVNPIMDAYRSDPRMAELCGRIGMLPAKGSGGN